MSSTFTYDFDTPVYKGKSSFQTGVFINNEFRAGSDGGSIDVINPTNGNLICKVAEATPADVSAAVLAAQTAFSTTWGLKAPGPKRSQLLNALADLMEQHNDELAALEALDNGKAFQIAKRVDVPGSIATLRYFAGWADKITGQVIESHEGFLNYTRHEPIGVCGQIIPWNFPLLMFAWKLAPALATGNTIVLKPSELTPLTALFMCGLIVRAGFPPGVVNVLVGYGNTVGEAITGHEGIEKIAFTGSTLVGKKVMEKAAKINLKKVTLELGGKSPSIIFDDTNLEQAVEWAAHGIYFNHGQCCCAGSRIFVQESIYDRFLAKFTEKSKSIKVGDPFGMDTTQGPQVSKLQYDRIMNYIECGKQDGATIHLGGARYGNEGYFIQPTIFTNTTPNMGIVKEEIFGPVGVVIPFKDDEDVVRLANDTMYGLAAAVFSKDMTRAIKTAHRLQAGIVWVNCANVIEPNFPFGGFKQSGIGREGGEYALANYTNVKVVCVNLA